MDEERPEREARARRLDDFVASVASTPPSPVGHLVPATEQLFRSLEGARVAAVLLKGPALTRWLYTEVAQRNYVDIDLLVAPGQRTEARRVLERLGYVDATSSLGIDDIGHVVHAQTWVAGPDADWPGTQVDFHLWFPGAQVAPELAWPALLPYWARIRVGGEEIPTLGRVAHAVIVACHAAQHGPGYEKGINELRLANQCWPVETWTEAAELASQLGATDVFAAGLRLTFEGRVIAAELGLPNSPATDWAVRNQDQRPRGTFHLQALREGTTLRDRLEILRRALLPQRDWIMAEHPWARTHAALLIAGYTLHILRAPAWALRAWRFSRRAPR